MSEHTPGPWKYTAWGETISISSKNCLGIAHVNPNGYGNKGIPDRIDVSNARLISAAPELLDALKGLVNVCTHPQSTKADMQRIAREALAAIRKAEGE